MCGRGVVVYVYIGYIKAHCSTDNTLWLLDSGGSMCGECV